MKEVERFFNSPIETYKSWLTPDAGTSDRLCTTAAVVGVAALVVAAAAHILTLTSMSFAGFATSLLLKRICTVGLIASVAIFVQAFFAHMASTGDAFWLAVYRGTLIAGTVVPPVVLGLNGIAHLTQRPAPAVVRI